MFSGIGILLTGVILLVVDYSNINGNKGTREANFGDAMWMGICQGISVLPGLSRFGLTISAGLFCGLSWKFAVKYSLLMSIPAAFSYTHLHGARAIARLIQDYDYIWGFDTATAEEALELRHAGITKPVLILGIVFEEYYEELAAHDVRITI